MIAQTTTRPPRAARPLWPAEEVTIGVVQSGVASTSGSLHDWPWLGLDLGTAIWPVIAPKQKSERRPSRPEAGHWNTDALAAGVDSVFEPTVVVTEDDGMARMEAAAEAGDEGAFLAAKDSVDWETRPAEDFLRAVQLALSAGAHMAARNLAAQGAARFPDRSRLAKYARILAPPRVFRAPAQPNAGIRANRDWMMAHGAQYHGRWVALREGQLLAVGDSLDSVIAQVGKTSGALFTKVY